jgi:hypothetical protein
MYIYSEEFQMVVYVPPIDAAQALPKDYILIQYWMIPGVVRDDSNTI